VARQSGLGRGLGSLIPSEVSESTGGGGELLSIPVGSIEPNPNQPRQHFDEESLAELAASIRDVGVLQPLLVRPLGDGRYQLVAGERRWRAARRAGVDVVPALVRDATEVASAEQALIENLHREDLSPLEEAAAYQQLIEDFGLTHEVVAGRVGKSRSAISNTLRLLTLPPAIQQLLAEGRLSAGHAKALLTTPDRSFQEQLARRAAAEGWSVRAVEEAVRDRGGQPANGDAPTPSADVDATAPAPANAPAGKLRPPGLLELEQLLAEHLDTRVSVAMSRNRGKIVVEFADLADLERIYRRMAEPAALAEAEA
jgi:ParB family transcriptional regulator, chromosome partitioning protein